MDLGTDSDADAYSPPQEERPTKKPKRFSRAAQDSDDEFADDDFIVPDDDELDLIESQALKKKKQSTAPKVTSSKTSSVPVKPSAISSASRLQVPAGRSSMSSVSSKPTTPTEEPYEFLMNPLDEHRNPPSHPDYDKRTLFIPEKTLNKLTPFEKQFWAIKRKHNDTVLFFQKGKFYELYEDDAVIAHREFGLKMTDRVRMKMAGVPESSFITFANKFLALGYKVGRVDQCETAVGMGMRKGGAIVGKGPMTAGGDDNKIVRRELKHIYTNGTIVDADCLPDEMSSYCVSIKEVVLDSITRTSVADKNDESLSVTPVFGVCFLDAGVAEFKMRHFVDDVSRTQLETLLRSMRIKEVIHEKGGLSKRTLRIVKNTVAHDCNITMLKPNAEFYDAEQTLRKLNLVFNSDLKASEALTIDDVDPVDPSILPDAIQQVLDKPEALSALGGMLNYLTQLNLEKDVCASRNFDVFDPAVQQGSMILDAQSLTHLNVLMNEQGDTAGTLLSLVNRACTPFGKRLMRIWLLSPLSNLDAIHARQEAVEALMTDSSFREDFDVFAKSLPDIERIRPRIYAGNCKSRDFARVLKALTKIDENVELLADRASTFTTKTVESVLRSIPAVSELAREIQAMYQDEQSFEPKSGAYEPFDEADKQVEEVERSLNKELARAATAVKLPRDRVKFKDIGTNEIYQIEVPVKTKVPIDWALVSQTQSVKRYYSPEVRQLVKLLKEGRETRVAALKDFQANLFRQFQEHGDTFLLAVKGIAELDCLVSLAKASYAMGEPSCRPEFVDSDVAMVDFEELRHPCLASASTSEFIANDISLGVPSDDEAQGKTSARVTILTGGNMAGKSTTARTTATAVILAQLGCRVPASKARLSAVDRIASRMGANDQLFRNNSTFMVEMLEASRILKDCTPRSLIIMDELGRGTSTFDGQAIAYAVLHHLIGRTRSLSFFLTHYTSLAHEFDNRFGVANKHMQVLVDSTRREVVFTYKLVHGIAESSYGTEVAALAGVPLEICDRATHISRDFAAATKEAEKKRLEKLGDALSVATLSDFAMLFKAGLTKSTKDNLSTASVEEEVNVDDETIAFLRRQIGSVLLQRKQNGAAAVSGQDASSST
jgi:DNA mismatch repair protein MSH6